MIKKTICGVALGTIILSSGATANSVTNQTCTPEPTKASTNTVKVTKSGNSTDALKQSIFNKINNYRVSQGLGKLASNTAIDTQAKIHSQDMANGKVPFGHTGFSQRVKAVDIPYSLAGENVAYNQGYDDPATVAYEGWLKSPGHLAAIRGNYNKTGIGVISNSRGEIYFTQIFFR